MYNRETRKEMIVGTFQFKMAILGVVETLAVFALVAILQAHLIYSPESPDPDFAKL